MSKRKKKEYVNCVPFAGFIKSKLPRSLHGCTNPLHVKVDLHKGLNSAEVNATAEFFDIPNIKASELLVDLKYVYALHGLSWNSTSKAIRKL